MATMTVWKFDTADGADGAEAILESLQKEQLIEIHDAATVSWPAERKRPKTRQLNDLAGWGVLGGAFWGLLFGMIFFIPLIGLAVGAAAGAFAGALSDVGIDDDFIESVREKITPGTSALFLLSGGEVVDRIHEAFQGSHADLIKTNLSHAEEEHLRAVFAGE